MSVKAAKSTEAPVTEWETFEGAVYGYDAAGDSIVEITAPESWAGKALRGWAALTPNRDIIATGQAGDLRLAKKAALAALRAH